MYISEFRLLVGEFVAEHRQAALRLLSRCFVLKHVPVLDELTVNDSNDVGGDPIRLVAPSRKPSMKHHKRSVRGNDVRLVFKRRWRSLYQIKKAITSGFYVSAVLDVIRRPVTFSGCIVSPIKQRIERLENKCLVPVLNRFSSVSTFHWAALSFTLGKMVPFSEGEKLRRTAWNGNFWYTPSYINNQVGQRLKYSKKQAGVQSHGQRQPELWLRDWYASRPDVDPESIAIFGRIIRLSSGFERFRAPLLDALGLTPEISDLTVSLLRAGPPYELNVGALTAQATFPVTTTGAMTYRIDRAEALGLVERRRDPSDRRGVIVRLTKKGLASANRNVDVHVEFMQRILLEFSSEERVQLSELLQKLLEAFTSGRNAR
jgi:DNA-binding MarR family transcriptional regulator